MYGCERVRKQLGDGDASKISAVDGGRGAVGGEEGVEPWAAMAKLSGPEAGAALAEAATGKLSEPEAATAKLSGPEAAMAKLPEPQATAKLAKPEATMA